MAFEHRRQHRIGVALELRIRGSDRFGHPFEEMALSHDVSRGGCSFHATHEIAPGSTLNIEIFRRLGAAQSSFFTTGKVLRVVPADSGQHLIGVQFIGPQFPTYTSEATG